jgi:uncharacterized membrane protein YeaQ/YmgE (transglycosylase-associated protein family)
MDLYFLIAWLIIGLVSGIVVHFIDRRDVQGGIFAAIFTGTIGAFLGGAVSNLIFNTGATGLNVPSLFIAFTMGLFVALTQRVIGQVQSDEFLQNQESWERKKFQPAYFNQISPSRNRGEHRKYHKNTSLTKKEERKSKLMSSIRVKKFLGGIAYPTTKDDLIKVAIDNGANDNIIYTLEQLPYGIEIDKPSNLSKQLRKIH